MKRALIALTTTIACLLPGVALANIPIESARDRHCHSYKVASKKQGFEPYRILGIAGQRFEVHNLNEYVSVLSLITPSGHQIGDFLLSPGEVKSFTLPESGNYRIRLANDKDFYDLRFCAY